MSKETNRVRAFAPFIDKEHQQAILDDVLRVLPKKHHFRLYLYLGMMDSTIAEGYGGSNDNS